MIQEDKLISIVIPTYNRSSMLKQTLPHYLRQKYLKEVIIVDDGSTDGTEDTVNEFIAQADKIKYIRLAKKKTAAAARNAGVNVSTGEYILFGEDDIFFKEDYSSQLLQCISKDHAAIISGRIIYLKNKENIDDAIGKANSCSDPLINKRLLYLSAWKNLPADREMPFTQGCFLAKREVFKQCKFDEHYGGNGWRDETDFQIQAAKLGHKIYLCPHTVCFHLPRKADDKGGQWSMNTFIFSWWAIKNNNYFLKKHYAFLKDKLVLPYSKIQLMFFAFLDRLAFITNKFLYKIKLKD